MEQQPHAAAQLEQSHSVVDLHHRRNDALSVTLWWVRGTMDTFVTVEDGKASNFSFDVPSPDKALDCFYHPMVYAPDAGNVQQRRLYAATEGDQ